MEASEKQNRIVEARMKLKARFEEKMKNTPSVGDNKPMGTGRLNRHGMPVIPIGQTITTKWPVLDLGFQPDVSLKEWKLILDGDVEQSDRTFLGGVYGVASNRRYFRFSLRHNMVEIEYKLERCSFHRSCCFGNAERNSNTYHMLWL
jgi:hypothetical protein